MTRRILLVIGMVSVALLTVLAMINLVYAQGSGPQAIDAPQAALGTAFTYQGQLKSSGAGVSGACDMAFRLFDAVTVGNPVGVPLTQTVAVNEGFFTAQLDFGASAFNGQARWLEIAVKCPGDAAFTTLTRQALTAAPYALYAPTAGTAANVTNGVYTTGMYADPAWLTSLAGSKISGAVATATTAGSVPWSGLTGIPAGFADGIDNTANYQNVVVVAKSGGDYATVQAAIDSITMASETNPYLVWVAPGVFSETVTMKPYVHLLGAGQDATVITSTATSNLTPPATATLLLAAYTSVRDLTVGNGASAAADRQVAAVRAGNAVTGTLLADIKVLAIGQSDSGYGYYGLINLGGLTLRGGSYTARGGTGAAGNYHDAIAIYNHGRLDAENVSALGETGYGTRGLSSGNSGLATLHGGSFIARGGTYPRGISNDTGATLVAYDVTVLGVADAGTTNTMGASNNGGPSLGAFMILYGGSYTARGSTYCIALDNNNYATLTAEAVSMLAETGTNDYGLRNTTTATATLRGGSYIARGGTWYAYGIRNEAASLLDAESVMVLAENAASSNYAIYNTGQNTSAILRGGTYSARGGANAAGIEGYNGAALTADNVTARGENGSSYSRGLHLARDASLPVPTGTLRGGTFIGHGGTTVGGANALGLDCWPCTVTIENVTAIGEGATSNYGMSNGGNGTVVIDSLLAGRGGTTNYGLYSATSLTIHGSTLDGSTNSVMQTAGTLTLANSRLIGSAVSGTASCTLVSRGTAVNTGTTCP